MEFKRQPEPEKYCAPRMSSRIVSLISDSVQDPLFLFFLKTNMYFQWPAGPNPKLRAAHQGQIQWGTQSFPEVGGVSDRGHRSPVGWAAWAGAFSAPHRDFSCRSPAERLTPIKSGLQ